MPDEKMTDIDRRMFRYRFSADDKTHGFLLSGRPVAAAVVSPVPGKFEIEFWAERNDCSPTRWDLRAFGTGHPLPSDAEWVATCPRTPEGLVLHLYRVPMPKEDG